MLLSVTGAAECHRAAGWGFVVQCSGGLHPCPHHGGPMCGSRIMMGWDLMGWASTDASLLTQASTCRFARQIIQISFCSCVDKRQIQVSLKCGDPAHTKLL